MQRDLDLIRHILLTIESDDFSKNERITVDTFVDQNLPSDTDPYDNPSINSPYEQEFARVSYHIDLLLDENFIEATRISAVGRLHDDFIIQRMTAFGHDYLDSVREESVWKHIKDKLGPYGKSVTLSTVTTVAQAYILQKLGI